MTYVGVRISDITRVALHVINVRKPLSALKPLSPLKPLIRQRNATQSAKRKDATWAKDAQLTNVFTWGEREGISGGLTEAQFIQ